MTDLNDIAPEEYHEALSNAGIRDVESLVKNWADSQSALGSSIRIPGKDAGPEAKAEFDKRLMERVPGLVRLPNGEDAEELGRFYSALGRPESADKYTIPAEVEGIAPDAAKQIRDWVADFSHKANLTDTQARQVHEAITGSTRENLTAYSKAIEERTNQLKSDWGQGYDQRMAMVEGVVRKLVGDEGAQLLEQELSQSGLERNPTLTRLLAKVAEGMGEDEFMSPVDRSRIPASVTELQLQLSEVENNPAYLTGRKDLVEKALHLRSQLEAARRVA